MDKKEAIQNFWRVFEDKTPQECFDFCTSCIGLWDAERDKVLIYFAKYFQAMYEHEYDDEVPFPMDDNKFQK